MIHATRYQRSTYQDAQGNEVKRVVPIGQGPRYRVSVTSLPEAGDRLADLVDHIRRNPRTDPNDDFGRGRGELYIVAHEFDATLLVEYYAGRRLVRSLRV